jgi:hypothetical protein
MYIVSALSVFLLFDDQGGVQPSLFSSVLVAVLATSAGLAGILIALRQLILDSRTQKEQQVRIVTLEKKTEDEPEKVRFAWDLARVKLETYFDRNLAQVRTIFYVGVVVMIAGFAFVLWGLRIAVTNPGHVQVALIASASGVITQFIGLTFMLIYRSTMLQAAQFMSVLERINTVGMAVQILDAMDDSAEGLKDNTRVDIIRLLLAQTSEHPPSGSKRAKKPSGQKAVASSGSN